MHKVKCKYCGEYFDRDKLPFVKESNRYSHKECYEKAQANQSKEDKDKEALENYIMKLFNEGYVSARIRKQINDYVSNYGYSYSGIHKALVYFFEIKGNSIEKANNGIGIVPYVYKDAYNYYYSIWEAQQKNKHKDLSSLEEIQETVIHIPSPKRPVKRKRKLFSFLDKE